MEPLFAQLGQYNQLKTCNYFGEIEYVPANYSTDKHEFIKRKCELIKQMTKEAEQLEAQMSAMDNNSPEYNVLQKRLARCQRIIKDSNDSIESTRRQLAMKDEYAEFLRQKYKSL